MDIQIMLKKGMGDIHFGCSPEFVRNLFGEPEGIEELENAVDGNVESIVMNYPDSGLNFFFDADNGEPTLNTIESDNLETILFNTRVFAIGMDNIVTLMNENGYTDIDEEVETWGEQRITFDDAQIDFYFDGQKLTLVSWSSI